MTFYILCGLFLTIGIIIYGLVKIAKKTGQLKSENQSLKESREQSEKANDAEITVDRHSDATLRDQLRKDWSK